MRMPMFVGHGRDQGPFGWSIMFSSDYIDVLSLPQKETSFFFHASPERGTTTILENYAILPQDVLRAVALLPLAWLIILVIRDALSSISRPTNRSWRPISNVVRTLGRPFNDFLEWEDMAEYDPSNPVIIVSPSWKKRVVVAASCPLILWSGWLAISTLSDVSDKHKIQHLEWNTIYFSLITTGWLYTLLRIVFWPLNAAPVGNILFYAFQDLNYFVSFANSAYLASKSSPNRAETTTNTPDGQENKRKKKREPLIVFLLKANSADILLDIALEIYKSFSGFIPAYALKQLLSILATPDDGSNNGAWGNKYVQAHYYALMTFVANLSFAQCDLAQGWCTRRCYERTRGVIFCALHYKALRRRVIGGAAPAPPKSNKVDQEEQPGNKGDGNAKDMQAELEQERSADLGKVVNLMQGDAYAVAQRFWELSPLFGAPIRIAVALYFLHNILGTSAFAGVAVILSAYLINWPLMKWNLHITRYSWKARDKRMTGVNELFQSIRFLKLMGWEGGWAERVLQSPFLVGLLGEMSLLKGKVYLDKSNHKVAYCAQLSWLEHATIRDNIVYGSPLGYDEARYDAVVAACALERDLEILPAGDMTEIGEKGVSLSGGQRARVALARALYSSAKTILLDDPLAAVDMHTARHLVQYCFGGPLMANRTVVLVTHHVKLCLPSADYLVEIHGGRIEKQGSIAELKRRGQLTEVLSHDVVETETEPESSDKSHSLENEADLVLGSHETPDGSTKVGASTPSDEGETENQNPKKPKWRLSTAEAGKLVDEEARAEGRVSWRTYKTYIQAAGYWSWGAAFLLMIQIRGINILNQFYLSKWGEAYNHPKNVSYLITNWLGDMKTLGGDVTVSKIPIFEDLPPPDQNVRPWLLIYFLISLLGAFTVLGYISLGYYASLQASRSLFKRMLARLSRAPTRFFDVTPIGRILNRFVADIGTVDGTVNNSARSALSGALNFVSSFIVIVYVVPTFAPFALFIAWLYVRLAPHYIRTSRDLRRLESISLSPAFAGFDELLHGLVHVRAFGAEQRYQDRFHHRVDTFQAFDHSYWLVAFWLRWRYDCLGSVVVYLTTLFALSAKVSTGFAAVVILNSEVFAEASRQVVRVLAQVELDFNSVERIGEYLDVVQEAPAIIEKSRPPAYWPSSTNGISVEDLWVRYSETSPDVLLGLSFEIRPGEKVGVVGRTGSGKTTLCAAFLRVVEARQGRIMVDGIDISKIGLEDLRTRITVVSQDVALFEGSVRSNLDPFEEHSDEECWDVLRRCHLATNLSTSETNGAQAKGTLKKRKAVFTTLEEQISVAGGSLSAGQRQLVALARAMLRRSQVVLTDEATSAIDLELDDQIQQTIRQELGDATVITIAHRLRTVIEYDRILVLDRGRIVEFDTPARLLRNPEGVFAKLCRGSADWEDLKRLVRE
ncbi:hypothetical protein FRB91_007151 [Serendipita sp. 411]|nr:hypothetical protein FRB91_007151 [Serendipita sp. 411]